MPSMKKIKLVLKDGTVYEGESFGADVDVAGEVVFNTGMVGYPESLTDPSYRGQILVLTYPLIGNYGVPKEIKDKEGIKKFFESDEIHVKGLIVSEYSDNYSHWNADISLGQWLKKHKIPGITSIDTRSLTQKLREKGTMLGKIISSKDIDFHDPNLDNLVEEVSIKKPLTYKRGHKKIIAIDTGMKNNIIRNFLKRNITVQKVPWDYDFFNEKFDGVFIANGPGDPAMITKTHELLKKCIDKKIPIFGICLGNQALAIAAGAKTYKLKYGHRSQNQPCMDLETGRCYITSQNHGFAVDAKTLPKGWKVWFENVNDKTVEGIKH
ncbi:glutamine-hydrolyzing carbamoyl-phosphate synthase small subunit, partial [Patescibacteria group bacterium]|nr:glutamine-hydrolyzing carbamoyl-phosphate synthase small subunit [Patescibacteria group bacterium]